MANKIAVLPVQLDLSLYAGDGFAMMFVFTDTAGVPWDASGTWEAQVRSSSSSTEIITSFTTDDSEEAQGHIRVSLTGEQVRSLLGVTSVWDLQQTPAGGEPRTWYRGKIAVTEDVTRA